jgi:hypothetical protein
VLPKIKNTKYTSTHRLLCNKIQDQQEKKKKTYHGFALLYATEPSGVED